MKFAALALVVLASPSAADTFAERWPEQTVASATVTVAKARPERRRAVTRCHRQYFYRAHHRYWHCQRHHDL